MFAESGQKAFSYYTRLLIISLDALILGGKTHRTKMKPKTTNNDIQFVWMDGTLVPYAEAKVPVLSHSLHYGTAAFEGIRAYNTADGKTHIFRGTDHLKRFLGSIQSLGAQCPYSLEDLLTACRETIRANGLGECYLRPLAYVDDAYRGLKLPAETEMRVAILAWKWGKYLGDDVRQKGARVMVCSYRRPDVSSALPWAKLSGAYLYSVLARRQATECGYDESLLLDTQGYVAEGSGENLFVIRNGALTTPPSGSILPGFTRDSVMALALDAGIPLKEEAIIRNQLYLADELFFAGTAIELNAIREVDGHPIGVTCPGPVTQELNSRFLKAVRGELPKFHHWLDPV